MYKEFYWWSDAFPVELFPVFPLPFITFPFKPSQETVPCSVSQNEQSLSHDCTGMITARVLYIKLIKLKIL